MLTRRIIPCLDIKNGRTVKGVNFLNLKDAGDPVELAHKYSQQGADELVFLDISGSLEQRALLLPLIKSVGEAVNIPFSVGGGIKSLEQVHQILYAGADKVSVNSTAVAHPKFVKEVADHYGSQCIIVAVDAKQISGQWIVHTHGGSRPTSYKLFDWVRKIEDQGAGEILFTSMDHDGSKNGFALEALQIMDEILTIPIIASGGAGNSTHFLDLFMNTNISAGLAASIFHYHEVDIRDLKAYLYDNQVPVRAIS